VSGVFLYFTCAICAAASAVTIMLLVSFVITAHGQHQGLAAVWQVWSMLIDDTRLERRPQAILLRQAVCLNWPMLKLSQQYMADVMAKLGCQQPWGATCCCYAQECLLPRACLGLAKISVVSGLQVFKRFNVLQRTGRPAIIPNQKPAVQCTPCPVGGGCGWVSS